MVSQPPDEDIAPKEEKMPVPIQEATVLYVDQLPVFSYRAWFSGLSSGQRDGAKTQELPYSEFKNDLTQGQILSVLVGDNQHQRKAARWYCFHHRAGGRSGADSNVGSSKSGDHAGRWKTAVVESWAFS